MGGQLENISQHQELRRENLQEVEEVAKLLLMLGLISQIKLAIKTITLIIIIMGLLLLNKGVLRILLNWLLIGNKMFKVT